MAAVTPPLPVAGDLRPTAIKGPTAFGPHDADLFRRLGRKADTATLLNHILNDQISLVVVSGESGAGKTSLLRAGLGSVLKNQNLAIEYHYWEGRSRTNQKSVCWQLSRMDGRRRPIRIGRKN
jgi:hypothetical protein